MTVSQERVAGRELDAEVAERVFGLSLTTHRGEPMVSVGTDGGLDDLNSMYVLPRYSAHVGSAFQVVEAMRAKGYRLALEQALNKTVADQWHATFWRIVGEPAKADTAPLAICRAALAAFDSALQSSVQGPLSSSHTPDGKGE